MKHVRSFHLMCSRRPRRFHFFHRTHCDYGRNHSPGHLLPACPRCVECFALLSASANVVAVIGSKSVPLVRVFMLLLYPIAKPIAMVLDCALGKEIGTIYDKDEVSHSTSLLGRRKGIELCAPFNLVYQTVGTTFGANFG